MVGFTSSLLPEHGVVRDGQEAEGAQAGNLCTLMGGANCETPMGQEIVKNVPHIDFVHFPARH